MALIMCPECSKEISDKVKNCPNCGYPLVEEKDDAQKVELTSVSLKIEEGKRKRLITKTVSFLVIISLALTAYYFYNTQQSKNQANEYAKNIDVAVVEMLSSGSSAESLMNLTAKVWHNAIWDKYDSETSKYTTGGVVDFNDALKKLFADGSTKTTVSTIKTSQQKVADIMTKLQNPPEEYKTSYATLLELYSAYQGVTDLAISPTGNLTSFQTSKSQKVDKFIELYNKLKAQLPTQAASK